MTVPRQSAVFVDRDGTLNEMVYDETHGLMDSPRRPDQVRLKPYAGEFMRAMKAAGYRIVVVSNQPGIAKGTLSFEDLDAVTARLADDLRAAGATWDDIRYCPHHPDGGPQGRYDYVQKCTCRKPLPGLLLTAARDQHIDLQQSWMVGDGLNDMESGRSAGCRTILVTSLKMEQVERFFKLDQCRPDWITQDLRQAAQIIREHS